MIPWNASALDLFHQHCAEHRDTLLASGADPDEVFADWEELIANRAAAAKETEISPERVRHEIANWVAALEALGEAPSGPPSAPEHRSSARTWLGRIGIGVLWVLGVILPLGVLLFELIAGFCAEILFDPIPTWLHAVLIFLVPVANAWALLGLTRHPALVVPRRFRWLGIANGLALGIAGFYALQFAIVTPFAVMGILWFGIGLIPLAPVLSWMVAGILRFRLASVRARPPTPPPAAWWRTALPAFLLLLALTAPQAVVTHYVPQANDANPRIRARAVKILRAIGDQNLMLQRCYRENASVDLFSLLLDFSFRLERLTSIQDYQQVYYRVTGTPFNAAPPPRLRGIRGQSLLESDWFDRALGGDRVAARIKNLALAQSRLDGRVDSASAVAYLEWTLEFRNASPREREARALIELPPGGVVSRVTLWINDEPHEAAFGGRSQTRQAYQAVAVRQRRDPVLVTTAGPDRILLQCFPVPVQGTMKTRIGITAPLWISDAAPATATLRLPALVEQNFTADSETLTRVWIESDQLPSGLSDGLAASPSAPGMAIRGALPADESAPPAFVRLPMVLPPPTVVAADARLPKDTVIRQTWVPPAPGAAFPSALAVVIDGSARMKTHANALHEIVDSIPPETTALFVLASDLPQMVTNQLPAKFLAFTGGCDNGQALARAAAWAAEHDFAPIVWLHAAQPLESPDLEAIRQTADFARGRLTIYSHQFGSGADRISEKLMDLNIVRPLAIFDSPAAEIVDILGGKGSSWRREKVPLGANEDTSAPGSSHIVRLWAAEEVTRLSNPFRKTGWDDAIELARTFQLVTPVSGAVVLETAAQYRAHDLTPADPATTPGIVPEPGTLALLLIGGPFLLALRRRRRNP